MKKWIGETLSALRVTTVNPIGWSFEKIHLRIKAQKESESSKRLEHVRPVILVHGIFHNGTAFYQFERSLRKKGFQHLSTIELWTSLKTIEDLATQLKRTVAEESLKDPQRKVNLVAHSLGGMVVRVALLDPGFANRVDKIVFLGTPHQGSAFYQFPIPPCLKDLARNSKWMTRLRNEPLPGGVRYFNLRGGTDLITPSALTFLPHVFNFTFEGIGHAGLLSQSQVVQAVGDILEDSCDLTRSDAQVS